MHAEHLQGCMACGGDQVGRTQHHQLDEGCGTCADGVHGGLDGGGGHLANHSPNFKREWKILWGGPSSGHLENGDGDFELPSQDVHRLT